MLWTIFLQIITSRDSGRGNIFGQNVTFFQLSIKKRWSKVKVTSVKVKVTEVKVKLRMSQGQKFF